MDEIGTTDIRKLPGSGTIKLSEIKSEFKKGNNLLAYLGAASGVPSSAPLKLTDFYGKEQGGGSGGFAPYGTYQGSTAAVVTSTSNDYYYWNCRGTGTGDPYPFGQRFGVTALVARGDYNNIAAQSYKPATDGHTQKECDYYNQYLQIQVLTPAGGIFYNGSWRIFTRTFNSIGATDIMEWSSDAAGKQIAEAMNRNQEWTIYLKSPLKEDLPDQVEIFNSEKPLNTKRGN